MKRLIVLVAALGLLASTAATQCDPSTPTAGHSVVRCHGHRSCDVTIRRATTDLYARRLHSFGSEAVADVLVDTVACALLRENLAVTIACGGAVAIFTTHVITKLKQAHSRHSCLRLVFSAPEVSHWKPISVQVYNGSDCVN